MKNLNNNTFRDRYNLQQEVCKALEVMNYKKPTPVQEQVIECVMEGKDLIVKSKTGSGKTAAFGIPLVNEIDLNNNMPQVLVLTPTRELAVQVCEELSNIGRYKKVRCLPVYGKQPIHIQLRQLKQRVHVVVGTPGRVADLIKKKHLRLEELKHLVIDEADELLKRGFIDEVEGIINKTPHERGTLLFSATMPTKIEDVCSKYMNEPERIEIESKETPIDQINQTWYEVDNDWKFKKLIEILDSIQPDSCMIFCNTRAKVEQLASKLSKSKYSCVSLHGKMAQTFRLRAINTFKEGKVRLMIATDLAGRGIHVDRLGLVINFNVPFEDESYVHRIGRTGRVGQKGQAISLVSHHEYTRWQEIQQYIGYNVPKAKDTTDKSINLGAQKQKSTINSKKKAKVKPFQKDITRIRINAGKKKKMRPGDIVGAISNIKGIKQEDIGIIDIENTCSYVDIFNNKGDIVIRELAKNRIKGKEVAVKKVRNK